MPDLQPQPQTESSPASSYGDRAQRFIETLRQVENTRQPEELLALFTEDAELRSLRRAGQRAGRDGVRQFWREYLSSFDTIESRFERVYETGDLVVLEWHSDATLASGRRIGYDGVSVIEYEGEKVKRFRTYYDSAKLDSSHRRH
jgi:ketosteroid isomerase-like protein